MLGEAANYKWRDLRLSLNGSYFHTDSYDSRIYAYERSPLYSFSFPSFYGEGMRLALMVQTTLWQRLTLPLGGDALHGLYFLMRSVGRLAFPLFAFLIAEGFIHTRDRRRYGMGLLALALLSVAPWHLARYGTLFTLDSQNVLFTLFLGFLALCAVRRREEGRLSSLRLAATLFILLAAARLLRTDYGAAGVGLILELYVLRHSPALQAAVGFCMLPFRWKAGLAFIPINLYNGRRGFIRDTIAKYAFYLYYPLHLLLLYLIREALTA